MAFRLVAGSPRVSPGTGHRGHLAAAAIAASDGRVLP